MPCELVSDYLRSRARQLLNYILLAIKIQYFTLVHKTSLTLPLLEVPVSNQESKLSCI